MENKRHKNVPEIKGLLRSHVVEVPSCIRDCSGIKIFGKRIKSLLFTTDVAIIRNTNADAIIAVYPFTPQPLITSALVMAADVPVFCGVGGGITQGKRVVNLALDAEFKGAMGVVSINEDIRKRIESGATILNVSGGKDTPNIVRKIKEEFPNFPVIATGGPNEETIRKTIEAGANAITYTPPTNGDTMSSLMDKYRSL